MRSAHAILQSLLIVALASYALDCEAMTMTTPAQAMQCCAAMQCSRGGQMDAQQGMDCCKTMPAAHAPFLLPSFERGVSHTAVFFAQLPGSADLTGFASWDWGIAERNHAPPGFSPPALQPLRI
jgi:hypothetical protein